MEVLYGKAGRHIPKARREEQVWPYLYAFETLREESYPDTEVRCKAGMTFAELEADPELKASMPEGFVRWCCFNLKDDLTTMTELLQEKENWWRICEARAKGQKLNEIGAWAHLTSERVRQICDLLVVRCERKGGRELVAKLVAVNGRTDCLTGEEISSIIGHKSTLLPYLFKRIMEEDPVWYYWHECDVIVLEGGKPESERTEAYVSRLVDVIPHTSMTEVLDKAEREGYSRFLTAQTIRHTYEYDGYNYHRGSIQTQLICEDVMNTFFQDGIYIYDPNSLNLFREKAREKYGPNVPVPENDHAMTVLLNRIAMLRNRGIYVPAQSGILSEDLLARIRKYMDDNGQVSYMYNTLFGVFRDELVAAGVDNRYYLQGILKQDLGEGYQITRDYVTTNHEDKQLKDPVLNYIRDADHMVTKAELASVFHTSPYLAYNCALMDRHIINYFGQYMHVDNLHLTDEDKANLRTEVSELLSDGQIHETKELLKILRRKYPEIVSKAHLDAPYPVFSLVYSLMGDDFVLNRPYMALPGSEGAKEIIDIKGEPGTRTKAHTSMPKHRETAGPEDILRNIEAAGVQGMTLSAMHRQYHVTKNYLLNVCEAPNILQVADRYIAIENIKGYDEAKETIYQVLSKELEEHGMARRGRVCEIIRNEIPEFFTENELTENDAAFFLVKYIFQKEGYRNVTWYFHPHNRSISLKADDSDVTLMGQVAAFGRKLMRPMTIEEITERLTQLGYNTDNLKYNLHLCEDPFLFIYRADVFVLVESLGLTDEWVAEAGKKIKELLDAENGLVCIPQLTEDWLNENMPKIPMGIPWTCFLLQQLCFFYSERIGAKTLRPVGMYDFSRLHSFLLPYASPIQELSEAVWLWMVDKGWGGKTLMRSEIEDIFRDAKLIGFDDNGRCHRLDRCLDNSKYFAWNTTGSKVVVHKPTKEMIRALRG